MKKLFVVAFTIATFVIVAPQKAQAAYADGAALGAGVGFSTYADGKNFGTSFGNLYATGKFDGIDPIFGVNLGFQSSTVVISADWWLLNPNLGQAGHADVSLYLGPGAGVGLGLFNPFTLNLSARLPIGLSWVVKNNWEIFTECLFSLHVFSITTYNDSKNDDNDYTHVKLFGKNLSDNNDTWYLSNALAMGINVGFRYWF